VEQYAAYYTPALIGLFTAFLIPCFAEIYTGQHPGILDERQNALAGLGIFVKLFAGLGIPIIRNQKLLENSLKDEQSIITLGLLILLNFIVFVFVSSFLISALILAVGIALIDRLTFRSTMVPEASRTRNRVAFVYALIWLITGLVVAAGPVPSALILGSATVLLLAVNFWIAAGFVAMKLFPHVPQGVAILIFLFAAYLFISGPYNQKEIRLLPQ
jgi:hypothetical protein